MAEAVIQLLAPPIIRQLPTELETPAVMPPCEY
jgi:hypothetical protein